MDGQQDGNKTKVTRKKRDRSEYYKKWRLKNKEKIKEKHRKEYLNNIEIIKERSRLWRENNKDASRKKCRDWNDKNRDRVKELHHRWELLNKERAMELDRKHAHLRRARKRCVPVENIDIKQIYERDGWICQICGREVNQRFKWPNPLAASLDHVVPISRGGGHLSANVQLSHLRCNLKANAYGIKQVRLF